MNRLPLCSWCGHGIIACAVRWGYRKFCSDRCLTSYLGWVAGAKVRTDEQEDITATDLRSIR